MRKHGTREEHLLKPKDLDRAPDARPNVSACWLRSYLLWQSRVPTAYGEVSASACGVLGTLKREASETKREAWLQSLESDREDLACNAGDQPRQPSRQTDS